MDRRSFLHSLAGITSTIALTGTDFIDGSDRLGYVLPKRKLGATGERVTMLGLGGSHVGNMSERQAQKTIEAALEGGIRFFDTAESYQNGGSEQYYGRFLVPKYREDVFIMTKSNARTGEGARKHLEGSLRRMNTDYIDLWQVHSLDNAEDVDYRWRKGMFEVFREAKETGKVRHIGFTGHEHPSSHTEVLDRTNDFVTCQMPVNVLDPSYNSYIENVMPQAIDQGVGVLAMKTLSGGQIVESGVVPDRMSLREALYFVWSLPVSTLISGVDSIDQLQQNIELARNFQAFSEEERSELIDRVADLAGTEIEYYKV